MVHGLADNPPPVMSQGVEDGHHAGPALQLLPIIAYHVRDAFLDVRGKKALYARIDGASWIRGGFH